MSLTYGFYNSVNHDRVYDAMQMSSIFDGIIKDGIFMTIGEHFNVTAGSGMTVNVAPGRAWFNHTWTLNDAELPITVDTSEVVLKRIDALVLEVNHEDAVRSNFIKMVKGTPSSEPVKPTLEHTDTVNQYALAYITVNAGVTEITTADIENNVGGEGCPYVTGPLETIDASTMMAQWQAQFNNQYNANQTSFNTQYSTNQTSFNSQMAVNQASYTEWFADKQLDFNNMLSTDQTTFENWFAHLQNELDANQAANLQRQIDELKFVHFKLTYDPVLAGSTITLTNGTETITATAVAEGVTEVDAMTLGTWTISENKYGTSVNVTCIYYGNYEASIGGKIFITVTYDEEFVGQTITLTNGSKYYTREAVASLSSLFVVAEPGTWTASLTYDEKEYTSSVNCPEDGEYSMELHYVSLGYVAWLNSAGISTAGFDSLEDVLADDKTVCILATKHASVDYLLTWVEGDVESVTTIINNDIFAKWVTRRDYALDTLSGNTTIKALMDQSDYHGQELSSLVPMVPPLSSATGSNGVASASSLGDTYKLSAIFEGNQAGGSYQVALNHPRASWWVQYAFNDAQLIKGFKCSGFLWANGTAGSWTASFKFIASNDGSTWVDATDEFSGTNSSGISSGVLDSKLTEPYKYYRMVCTSSNKPYMRYNDSNTGAAYGIVLNSSIQLYSEVTITPSKYNYGYWTLKPQVPTMTSNTAPVGEVIFSSARDGSEYAAYNAFDNDASKDDIWMAYPIDVASSKPYIGYSAQKAYKLAYAKLRISKDNDPSADKYKAILQGSNDGSLWTDLTEELTLSRTDYVVDIYPTKNIDSYSKYRVQFTEHDDNTWVAVYFMQFYAWAPNGLVPVMTSNTTPSGEAFGTDYDSTSLPYYVFDGKCDTRYIGHNSSYTAGSSTIGYKFNYPSSLTRFKIVANFETNYVYPISVILQGSNDGTNWTSIQSFVGENLTKYQEAEYNLTTASDYYLYFRVVMERRASSSSYYATITQLQFYGRSLSVSVPTMTSNNAPSGEASASSEFQKAYLAFDKIVSTTINTNEWVANSGANESIQYTFEKPMAIKSFTIVQGVYESNSRAKDYVLKAKNDGDWVTLKSGTFANDNTNKVQSFDVSCNTAYKTYKVEIANVYASGAWISLRELNFYGVDYSEDVTITVHSANNDTIYYYDNGSPVTLATLSGNTGTISMNIDKLAEGVTLYSTVAKDTETGANPYSKVIDLDNTDFYLMPEGKIIYWYGYVGEALDTNIVYNTSATWTKGTNWTFNTNNIVSPNFPIPSSGGKYAGIGTTNTISLDGYDSARYVYTKSNSSNIVNKSADISALTQNAYVISCTAIDNYGNSYLWDRVVSTKTAFKDNTLAGIDDNTTSAIVSVTMYAIWLE